MLFVIIISANDDFANCNAIHLAKDADPEGKRTIGVLTKVDLVPQGTTYKEKLNDFRDCLKCLKYLAVKNSPDTLMEVSFIKFIMLIHIIPSGCTKRRD